MAYKAKSLKGAEAKVRQLSKHAAELTQYLRTSNDREVELKEQLRLLARLAADGPAFATPLEVAAAKKLRDETLREIGLYPDGTWIGK